MATITDFDAWLDGADPEGHEEVYALHLCVSNEEDHGPWDCAENGGKLFIKSGHTDDTLMIASPKAKETFLKVLSDRFCDPDMDMESWYGFRRAMAKDD